MLPIVSRETDKRDGHTRLVDERAAHFEAIVRAAVIDEYDFVPARDREFFELGSQFGDAARPVIDRDHDRQREARRRNLESRRIHFNHERRLPCRQWREPSHQMEISIPLAATRFRYPSPRGKPRRADESTV